MPTGLLPLLPRPLLHLGPDTKLGGFGTPHRDGSSNYQYPTGTRHEQDARTHTTDAIPNLNVRYTNAERSSQRKGQRSRGTGGRCSGSSGAEAREGIRGSAAKPTLGILVSWQPRLPLGTLG